MAKQKNNSVEPEKLLESFRQKDFVPLYLFHGEEDFLTEEFMDLLVEHAVDPSSKSFNLDVLHGKETDVKEVISHASSFPMMAERRVVIVRDADSLVATDANREILLRYVEHPLSSTILVFTMQKADMRIAVFKAFQEKGIVVECKPLYENQVPDWITTRVEKYGRMI